MSDRQPALNADTEAPGVGITSGRLVAPCNVCGGRDLACPKCQPENWASRWRAQRFRSYQAAVTALKRELGRG